MYKSKHGNIELRITGYDEPNNGRELHIAEIFVKEVNCSQQFFKYGWNRLNFNLSQFQFESDDARYVFVPAEGDSFVINTQTMEVKYLPYKGISTSCFKGNEFKENKLIIYYTDETVEVEL